jgi:sugar diacid utilization regulator
MSVRVTSLRGVPDDAHEEAIRAIAARLASQKQQVAQRVVDQSRQEIVDYRAPSDGQLLEEQFTATLEHVDALVASLQTGEPVSDAYLEQAREIAARRVHQGVPLESFLHAARLWAKVCWDTVLRVARTDSPTEREAALEIAGVVVELADRLSTTATHAYLDEICDRGLLRRDLLDAMLTAKGTGNDVLRLARRLHLRLEENYIVVLVRDEGVELEEAREQPQGAGSRLDRMVEETRRNMRPAGGSLLMGMRNGDLVVLYPVSTPADLDAVREDCKELAAALGSEVSIGMSGWHEGRASVGVAYAEAKDAVSIAARLGVQGRAVGLDEVLVDYLLDSSVAAQRVLDDVLRPLVAYDASRQAALVATLRAYLDTRCNVTKAAAFLFVNPNTVVYRLRRIKELTGRDPHNADDRLVLSMALRQNARSGR